MQGSVASVTTAAIIWTTAICMNWKGSSLFSVEWPCNLSPLQPAFLSSEHLMTHRTHLFEHLKHALNPRLYCICTLVHLFALCVYGCLTTRCPPCVPGRRPTENSEEPYRASLRWLLPSKSASRLFGPERTLVSKLACPMTAFIKHLFDKVNRLFYIDLEHSCQNSEII